MAIAAAFSSCEKESAVQAPETKDTYTYRFSMQNEAVRSVLDGNTIHWEAGDVVGFYAGSSVNVPATVDAGGSTLTLTLGTPLAQGDVIYAYFPYKDGSAPATAAPLSIPAQQSVSGGVYDADAMPVAVKPFEVTAPIAAGESTAALDFVNLASVVRFHVYSSDPAITGSVKSVCFNATTPLSGEAAVDITGDPVSVTLAGLTNTSVTTTLDVAAAIGSTREAGAQVPMVIAPGSYQGSLLITLDDASTFTYDIVNPFSIERSKLKPVGVDLARAKSGAIEGSGTEADPYIVHNAADLKAKMAETGVYIKLGSNILMPADWTSDDFNGVIDGQGNTIGGLQKCFIKGLTGTVQNVRFIDVNIGNYQSDGNCKGIVAQTASNSTISDIAAYGTLSSATTGGNSDFSGVGGIVGRTSGTTVISNCYVDVDIPIVGSNFSVGGILGIIRDNDVSTTIKNCTYAGTISGNGNYTKIGGIFGRKTKEATGSSSSIQNCLVSGAIAITGTGSNMVGGVFGALQGDNVSGDYVGGLTIKQCAFTGELSAGNAVGGIAGVGCAAFDCFVSGKVQGTNVTNSSTGGSAGIVSAAKGKIEHCIVAGARISGNNADGRATAGIVSKQNGNNTPVINSNAVINTTVQDSGFAIMGSTANLTASGNKWYGVEYINNGAYVPANPATDQDGEAFTVAPTQTDFEAMGYDFTNTWKWNAAGYPELKNVGATVR